MGKSNKKVKNDRINLLRRQYDAFLEEDKKRKERNEYILGKLDKMRSSTALVPISTQVRHRLDATASNVISSDNLHKNSEMYHKYVPNLECIQLNESKILNEISKKYILIPKRRNPIEKDYPHSEDAIDDKDWKSKYNILDDLKKLEKGEDSNISSYPNNEIVMFTSPKKSESKSNEIQTTNVDNNTNQMDTSIRNKNKDLTDENKFNSNEQENKVDKLVISEIISEVEKVPLETNTMSSIEDLKTNDVGLIHNSDKIDGSVTHSVIEPYQAKRNSDRNEQDKLNVNIPTHNIDNFASNIENMNNEIIIQGTVDQSHYDQLPTETTKYVTHENVDDVSYCEQIVANVSAQEHDGSYSEELVSCVEKQEQGAEEHFDENVNKNNQNQKDSTDVGDITNTERVHDVKDINLEGQIELNQSTYDTTQHYEIVEESIPMTLENTENTGYIDHDSEINDFESEQKEMFYSEQTDGDNFTYNQEDPAGAEYTAEDYQQNDQYAYYEGVQQEQAYATNINEHEESTEHYDPHYNEQYGVSYENQQPDNASYVNTNAYDQQQFQGEIYENQQFENGLSYESQQDNADLFEQENNINESELQENVIAPHDNEMYNQQLYSEQPDVQENIENQLLTQEGVPEDTMSAKEFQKENEIVGKGTKIMGITTPVEHVPESKTS